ncbi:trans-sialidase [Trypanosoma cruzi Dm28c]|uniref:Trans-sialidase n=1 Tax=Trypanosoma cruzi Dm28c TaxID=1416333 RepID=V5CJ97_TRYCR|nr:trans-sialidase [Trypanosoma cruzi Dm28c]
MIMPLTVGGDAYSSTPFYYPVFSLFLSLSYEESKQALNVTVKFEGTERNNSTHTVHTHIYLYALTCRCSEGTLHTQPSPRDWIQRKEEGRKRE